MHATACMEPGQQSAPAIDQPTAMPCWRVRCMQSPQGRAINATAQARRKRQPIPPRAGKASEDGAHHVAGSTTETKSPPWNVVWTNSMVDVQPRVT
jgi:hypothetical protein